ncbi:hypothetical protein ACQKM2_13650 [Streptomyces sp. NPDC004126]|uniref:hypothetical protein n=1 Tax=Streptomyces sp. NPDC004126 TaxID=3390695 RepID=UPI003CFFACEF
MVTGREVCVLPAGALLFGLGPLGYRLAGAEPGTVPEQVRWVLRRRTEEGLSAVTHFPTVYTISVT